LSEAKLHSPAAYLLFYRRRSETPLGPQYLQDLVSLFRNPPETVSPTEDPTAAAEEDDESGEGKLGGPITSSLHGSSSALVVAGAGVTTGGRSHQDRSLANGTGRIGGVGSSLTTMTTMASEEEATWPMGTKDGLRIAGPVRPPHMLPYGSQGDASWGFDNLDDKGPQPAEADGHAGDTLLSEFVNSGRAGKLSDDDDNGSTAADHDSAYGEGGFDNRMMDFHDEDGNYQSSGPAGTPILHSIEMADYQEPYSHQHRYEDSDTLHLEDAGLVSSEPAESPPAADVTLSDDEIMADAHGKLD
ncbi:hypothetical protein LTR53_018204, partial [Teratosphaeriaceae sp. CCFEE 6253]